MIRCSSASDGSAMYTSTSNKYHASSSKFSVVLMSILTLLPGHYTSVVSVDSICLYHVDRIYLPVFVDNFPGRQWNDSFRQFDSCSLSTFTCEFPGCLFSGQHAHEVVNLVDIQGNMNLNITLRKQDVKKC